MSSTDRFENLTVDVYHNILWSRYKGQIFSQLHLLARKEGVGVSFFQIAETEVSRAAISAVDYSCHKYPYQVLFPGLYSDAPRISVCLKLLGMVLRTRAKIVVLPGYDRVEHWLMLAAAIVRGRKRFVCCDSTVHDRTQRFAKGVLKRVFFAACDGFLAYGERSADYLVHYGAHREKVAFPCQAAALPNTYDASAVLEARSKDGNRSIRFLYVGRLASEKGLNTLLEAFSQMLAIEPEATLNLVGDGPLRGPLQEQAMKLGVSMAVSFSGAQEADQIAEHYLAASIFVLPSLSEPWGLVVNEALSYGCPVVVSDRCGCVPELVIAGQTGFTFKAGDVGDLCSTMLRAITQFSHNDAVAGDCIRVVSSYSPQRAAERMLAAFHQVDLSS